MSRDPDQLLAELGQRLAAGYRRQRVRNVGKRGWPYAGRVSASNVVLVASLALTLGIAAVAIVLLGHRSPERSTRHLAATRRYVDPIGWSVQLNGGFSSERSSRTGLGALTEVTFASFAQESAKLGEEIVHGRKLGEKISLGAPRNHEGMFPPDGTAFRMWTDYLPVPPRLPATRFPIQFADFQEVRSGGPSKPRELIDTIVARHQAWQAQVFIGPRATAGAVSRLRLLIASLRFTK